VTPRERLLAAIRGDRVERVPVHHLQFSGHAASVILGRPDVHVGGEHLQWLEINALWAGAEAHAAFEHACERDAVDLAEACGHELLRLTYWRWPRDHRPVERLDERAFVIEPPDGHRYTVSYNPALELLSRFEGRGRGGAPVSHLASDAEITESDLRRMVEIEEEGPPPAPDFSTLAARIRRYPQYLLRHGGGTAYVDMESVAELTAVALWPELFARLLMARARRSAAEIPALAAAGLELNLSGHDFCTSQGPSISPAAWRDVVMPALKVIVDACHENRMLYFYTGDGNFWPVAEDVFGGAGVDGWCETDRSAGMELRPLRERFPSVTFQGNIRSQVLHRGGRDDVVREVMSCLEVAHDLGRVIVGASNMIMPGTPPENLLAMMRTLEDNR
jgi:hypothetical protein